MHSGSGSTLISRSFLVCSGLHAPQLRKKNNSEALLDIRLLRQILYYILFKVLAVACYNRCPSFNIRIQRPKNQRSFEAIQSFFAFLITSEVLLSQAMSHRPKQVVVGSSNVLWIWEPRYTKSFKDIKVVAINGYPYASILGCW